MRRPGRAQRAPIGAEERERLIAMAAYYRAERRGFSPGHEMEDWLAAEAEIDRQIGRGPIQSAMPVRSAARRHGRSGFGPKRR